MTSPQLVRKPFPVIHLSALRRSATALHCPLEGRLEELGQFPHALLSVHSLS